MFVDWKRHLRQAMILLTCCVMPFVFLGCPGGGGNNNTNSNTNTNGNTNTNSNDNNTNTNGNSNNNQSVVECKAGTACVEVGNGDVRSCELLLVHSSAITGLELGFSQDVIGRSKFRGTQLAIAFVMRADSSLKTGTSASVIKLPTDIANLKIDKVNCYDRKGAKIDKPAVTLRRP